jgi:putative DNA primase/helicase
VRDGAELHSLQFIEGNGEKRFLTGGRVSGCYFAIGNPNEGKALCIAEGYATGATNQMARPRRCLKHSGAIGMNCGGS